MTVLSPNPRLRVTQALRDVGAWTTLFKAAEIPVLAQTALALEELRLNEEKVDANEIGETLSSDPLMTLKIMAFVAAHRGARVITDAETVTSALVMMGISPFFRYFGPQPTVEDLLVDEPQALSGLKQTLRRAHRGANFALAFAVHRMDHDAAVIYAAALLHDFAEMLLWCHAPTLALAIQSAQIRDPDLRSAAAQMSALNIQLADLQQSLMKAWHLPDLLIRITDDKHVDQPNVRCVNLAVRLARHTAVSWSNPAIPDDIRDIASLLNLSAAATLDLVQKI